MTYGGCALDWLQLTGDNFFAFLAFVLWFGLIFVLFFATLQTASVFSSSLFEVLPLLCSPYLCYIFVCCSYRFPWIGIVRSSSLSATEQQK